MGERGGDHKGERWGSLGRGREMGGVHEGEGWGPRGRGVGPMREREEDGWGSRSGREMGGSKKWKGEG